MAAGAQVGSGEEGLGPGQPAGPALQGAKRKQLQGSLEHWALEAALVGKRCQRENGVGAPQQMRWLPGW